MKNTIVIALVGKGGVGKTSISALTVRLLAQKYPDKKILAIDADPAVGLATALGVEFCSTVDDIRKAVRVLKKFNAPRINGDYCAIIHPDVAYDLMSDPAWKAPHEYKDTTNLYEGEIGKIAGVRFVETTEAKIFGKAAGSNAVDVYSTLVMGADAYGVTEITGGGLQHIVKQLGSAGTADPLNQRATAGWKAMKTAERLVEQYMVRIESCSTFNDIHNN